MTAAAALETGTIQPDFIVELRGRGRNLRAYSTTTGCSEKHRGHGAVNMHRAIRESCDVYFYTVGKILGIEKIDYFAKAPGAGGANRHRLAGRGGGI